jgi:hypothetical protein
MSFNALKQEAAQLRPSERRKLVAYLVSLDDSQDVAYREKLRRKIDDQTEGNWLTIKEMDRKLGTDQ